MRRLQKGEDDKGLTLQDEVERIAADVAERVFRDGIETWKKEAEEKKRAMEKLLRENGICPNCGRKLKVTKESLKGIDDGMGTKYLCPKGDYDCWIRVGSDL